MKNRLYVNHNAIKITSGKCDRILVIFPHPVVANRALAWCRKKGLSTVDSAIVLINKCNENGAPTFGQAFTKALGKLEGYKPYKVELEHLSK